MLNEVWDTLCMLAPWLLLGALLSGVLHVVLPANWLRRKLVGRKGVVKAVILGVPLPLCSCGVIPAGIGLKKNGASSGASIGFLISTPQTGVDSILVSATFFGWPFAFFKMGLAALTGLVGGWLTHENEVSSDAAALAACQSGTHSANWWIRLALHSVEVIQSIWKWLVIGILVSVLITLQIAPTEVYQQLGDAGLFASLFLMLAISLPLYVCATASVPIAAALVAGGLPTAAALVFLIAGPATNVATIGAIHSQFGFRNTIMYLTILIGGSIAGAIVFDWTLGNSFEVVSGHAHHGTGWISVASGVVLAGLIFWFAIQDTQRRFRRGHSLSHLDGGEATPKTIQIDGMHCQNCVTRIEDTLLRNPLVDSARAELESGTLSVTGDISTGTIADIVNGLGFAVRDA